MTDQTIRKTLRRHRRLGRALLILAVIGGVAGCSSPVGGPVAPTEISSLRSKNFPDVPLVPKDGVYLGVYYGDGTSAETNQALGLTPQLNLTYFGWNDPWASSPVLVDDRKRGQVSVVNWEPFDVDFADIVAGDFDDMLAQQASEAARLSAPVFVDFAAEMNEEEGWGGHNPELYVAAYQHVHDAFEGRDGGNVVWVWAPNNVDSEGAPPAMDYYPGDDYVDWTGIDGYNWGTSDSDFEWQSFETVFSDMYNELEGIGKPIIIGETASAEEGGSKSEWITEIAPTLRDTFPSIRAVIWFDVDKERDWRIRSSHDSLDAFRALAATSPFAPTSTD